MAKIEYYCTKCNSTNVEARAMPIRVIRKPMNEIPNPTSLMFASACANTFQTTKYQAHCLDCGHTLPLG